MPKDYTDYVLVVLDAGDRVYHHEHLRHRKSTPIDHQIHVFGEHKYVLELDRAYKIKWAPWSKVMRRSPSKTTSIQTWYFGTINEKMAKVPVTIVKTKYPLVAIKPLATIAEVFRSKKIGVLWYQMPCTNKCASCRLRLKDPDICSKLPSLIEPMHISKIHQPSGEMR